MAFDSTEKFPRVQSNESLILKIIKVCREDDLVTLTSQFDNEGIQCQQ